MYKSNISSRTKGLRQKETCYNNNQPVLDVLNYIGEGFMLRSQLQILCKDFYQINEHRFNDMMSELCSCGLLIKKQATDTQTQIYVMTKFSLSKYNSKYTTKDVTSIKLNNRKIWQNIYRTEYIIKTIIPMMLQANVSISIQNFFQFLDTYFIPLYTKENQQDIYNLYSNFYDHYELEINNEFMNDFQKATAELINYQKNFLKLDVEVNEKYLHTKNTIERERMLTSSLKEQRKQYYNFFNMTAAGFHFVGRLTDNTMILILFDNCNNMNLRKVYDNAICLMYMLERYLGFVLYLDIQVFMSDYDNLLTLREKENEQGYDYKKQEKVGYNKRDSFFYNYHIPKQHWDNICVDYFYYPLREKYNL